MAPLQAARLETRLICRAPGNPRRLCLKEGKIGVDETGKTGGPRGMFDQRTSVRLVFRALLCGAYILAVWGIRWQNYVTTCTNQSSEHRATLRYQFIDDFFLYHAGHCLVLKLRGPYSFGTDMDDPDHAIGFLPQRPPTRSRRPAMDNGAIHHSGFSVPSRLIPCLHTQNWKEPTDGRPYYARCDKVPQVTLRDHS